MHNLQIHLEITINRYKKTYNINLIELFTRKCYKNKQYNFRNLELNSRLFIKYFKKDYDSQ